MQDFTLGAGLAALAFWGFIASVVVAGIWYAIREREAQHETVRRLVESGNALDAELVDKLLAKSGAREFRPDRDFKLIGMILLPAAVGLAVLGTVLGIQVPDAKLPLLGVAGLVMCIGLGFMITAGMAARWYRGDDDNGPNRI